MAAPLPANLAAPPGPAPLSTYKKDFQPHSRICGTTWRSPDGGHAVFRNEIVNGAVVSGPYLAGNPTLRAEIGQISGTCSCARQKYNALQATLHKRFGMGLTYQVAFTYSRGMSDSIGYYGQGAQAGSQSAYWQSLFNQQSEFGPTYFDEKFNFVPSVVYELPFGRGRRYGSAWNKAVDGMFGGWQLGSIYTAHAGFPLAIKLASDPSGTGARSYRTNVIGTPHDPHEVGPGNTWLDVTAYATPALHTCRKCFLHRTRESEGQHERPQDDSNRRRRSFRRSFRLASGCQSHNRGLPSIRR